MGRTVSFTVTDEDWERMHHESVTIDVFQFVRWTRDNQALRILNPVVEQDVPVWAFAGEAY